MLRFSNTPLVYIMFFEELCRKISLNQIDASEVSFYCRAYSEPHSLVVIKK